MTNTKEAELSRFLILEDMPEDVKLILRCLRKEGIEFTHKAVDSKKSYLEAFDSFKPDLIIADFNLPSFTGMKALKIAREMVPDVPFIFATGTLGEENAVESLKQGASDFVLKQNLSRLPMAVNRSLIEIRERKQKREIQNALAISESRFRNIFENAPIGIGEVSLDGKTLGINKQAFEILSNMGQSQIVYGSMCDFIDAKGSDKIRTWLASRSRKKPFHDHFHTRVGNRLLDISLIPFTNDLGEQRIIGVGHDISDKAQMQAELLEKNMVLKNLFEAIPDLVYLKDNKGRYLMANKAVEKTFGVEMKDILNKKDSDFIGKPFSTASEATDKEVIKSKKLVATVQKHVNKNGATLLFDTHKKPILDNKNRVKSIVGISRDVTVNIKAQEQLKLSEAMLLEAENVASMGSWEFFVSTQHIKCSVGTANILGIDLADKTLDYTNYLEICHQEDQSNMISAFKSAIVHGESFVIDHRIIKGDTLMWFQTKGRAYQNEKGIIEKILGTIQNITEQKRNQEKLEKSQQLLKEAQSMAKVGSFDWNIGQNILHCTEEFYNILLIDQIGTGLTFDHYLERIHPLDRELTRKKIFDALIRSGVYDIGHRVLLPDNSIKTVRAIGQFKADEHGQPERLLGTIQDISHEKKLENALLEGQELERKRIAREVHDGIGQLLAATKFNLSALEGMPEEDKEFQFDKIHHILESTIDEARRITHNLSTKVLEELGLENALRELCSQARDLLNLSANMTYDINEIKLSENAQVAIYRIAQESINNIIKYSKATELTVLLEAKKNFLGLTIIDNGKGFDIDNPTHQKGNGLNNLNQRAKSLHGYVDIISSPGNGTEIRLKIPFETKGK